MTRNDTIVVGIDGTERALSAVRHATEEALRSDLDLTLVHVMPDYVPLSPMLPLFPADLRDLGTRLLAEAAAVVGEVSQQVHPSIRLLHGGAAWQLVAVSEGARMIVLGRESTPAWASVFVGAVTMGVAARADCPVVSVPEGWAADAHEARPVVVGVEAADLDHTLLEHAVGRAAALGTGLTVVHAWELLGYYDDIIVGRAQDLEWSSDARHRVEAQLARLRPEQRGVEVAVEIRHRQPGLALREASEDARLLVLGRHGHTPVVRHLGSTARALLREAPCPVEIVPPTSRRAAAVPPPLAEVGER